MMHCIARDVDPTNTAAAPRDRRVGDRASGYGEYTRSVLLIARRRMRDISNATVIDVHRTSPWRRMDVPADINVKITSLF
jgi:hypothetical protein